MNTRYPAALLLLLLSIVACKDPEENNLTDGQSANDGVEVIHVTAKLASLLIGWRDFTEESLDQLPSTAVADTMVTDSTSYPFAVQIDFDASSLLPYGTEMSGSVEVLLSGPVTTTNSVVQLIPENLVVDGWACSGIWQVRTNSETSFSLISQDVVLVKGDATVSMDTGFEMTWNSGVATTSVTDDAFSMTGTCQGVDRLSRSFAVLIHAPLELSATCGYITSGALDVVPDEMDRQTVDAGDGSCDGDFVVSGNEYQGSFSLE